jgi:hypothetical protein
VPAEVTFATKPQIALELIRQAISDHVPPAPVLGDNAYGINGAFRDGLRELGLEFFLQGDAQQLRGWAQPVALERKRTRWQVREPHPKALSLAQLFAGQKKAQWHPCSWKAVDGQTRRTRLAWMKVYLAGALDRGAADLEELWLVVDWPAGDAEPYHYYLAPGAFARTATKGAHVASEPFTREYRTVFPAGKDRSGLGSFRGAQLARVSSPPGLGRLGVSVCHSCLPARQKKLLV